MANLNNQYIDTSHLIPFSGNSPAFKAVSKQLEKPSISTPLFTSLSSSAKPSRSTRPVPLPKFSN